MTNRDAEHIDLDRQFWPLETGEKNDPDNIQAMIAFGLSKTILWKDLLKKDRVVILAEPGSGKTEEFEMITLWLKEKAKPAFFCRIELLQDFDFQHSLDIGTSEEFERWKSGNKKGYFFLDSVDEGRLKSHTAFETALRRFAIAIGDQLNQAKVFVSCRVSNWRATNDLSNFLKCLPEPKIENSTTDPDESIEVKNTNISEKNIPDNKSIKSEKKDNQIVYQLAPLDNFQIKHFASKKGIDNTNNFIEAIDRADVEDFAQRPQDLLELIAYWDSNGCFGRHAEMLDYNIKMKLKEHDPDRDTHKPLSMDDALYGAECLAAATSFQKKSSIILPDRPISPELRAASVEPKESLSNWTSDKIQTLVDRAIFDPAIYGTVKFHQRSIREYLTAKWIKHLIENGKPRRAIERLLFVNSYGRDVVIPSMRPIAAWLAIWDDGIMHRLWEIAPEILIENGDPSSLPLEFRKSLLIRFAEFYSERQYTGTSFDFTMLRRLADPQLASTINDLLKKYTTHDDVCRLMLKLIWHGQISLSAKIAINFATQDQSTEYIRTCAIRAVAAAGTEEQHAILVKKLLSNIAKLSSGTIAELCDAFFPGVIKINQLLRLINATDPPPRFSSPKIKQSIKKAATLSLPEKDTNRLLNGLYNLLKSEPFIDLRECQISKRYAWLLPYTIMLANQFIKERHKYSFNPIIQDLFLCYFDLEHFNDIDNSDRDELLKEAKEWPDFGYRLFWFTITQLRKNESDNKKHPTEWWHAGWKIRQFWTPTIGDLERFFHDLKCKRLISDRLIALTAIFSIYEDEKRPRKLRERIKRAVAGTKLETKLYGLIHPKPLTNEQKKQQRYLRESDRRQKEREKKQKIIRKKNQQTLKKNPEEIKNVGNAQKGEIWQRTTYLYDQIRKKNDNRSHGWGQADWKALIDEFGVDVAKNFRDGCISFWREHDPFTYDDRRISNSVPWPRIIGLTGLAMEATDNANWAKKITHDKAKVAARYAVCDLNGFPFWFKSLYQQFYEVVDTVIVEELKWEIRENKTEKAFKHTLSTLRYYGDKKFSYRYKRELFDLVYQQEPLNGSVFEDAMALILEDKLDSVFKNKLSNLAHKRFKNSADKKRKYTWLVILFNIDGNRGVKLLKKWLKELRSDDEKKETMLNFCSALINHRNPRFNLISPDYEKLEVLKALMPLIYSYVKIEEDIHHEDVYTPGIRDNAEEARAYLLNIILDTPGSLAYDVLMSLSKNVSNKYLEARLDHLAKEHAANAAEPEPWQGSDIAEFALSANKQPRSEKDLFEIASVRLDDLKLDIEEGDESDAAILLKAEKETEIRTFLANRLKDSSRSFYTVGSEEELADATRTDIRLNAPLVSAPVPIELKIADNWTLPELRERLENQLIGQYMRVSKYGIFLLVHNGKKKRWKNNCTRRMLLFLKLIETLKQDAIDLAGKYPNVEAIEVIGIDFTVR